MRVEGNGVFVDGDVHFVEHLFELLARHALGGEVEKNEVVIRAARNHIDAELAELIGHGLGVCNYLLLVLVERGIERLLEGDGLCRDYVHKRAALDAGEYGLIYGLAVLLLAHYNAAAGAAKRFVRGGGHEIGVWHGRGMKSRRNQTRDVRDVHHHICAHLVADLPYALEIYNSGIGAGARNYHLGLALDGDFFHLVVIDSLRIFAYAVGHDVEVLARNIYWRAVRKVAAVGKVHAHYRVAGLKHGKEHGQVCAGARMGLNVAIFTAEELLQSVAREIFGYVDKLTAAVVAVAGVAFGIFICQVTARRGKHRGRDKIFAGDELYIALLARKFKLQRLGNFGVGLFDERDIYHCIFSELIFMQ